MIQIKVSQLSISCAGETYPALENIAAMQRRRLSTIAKMALNSAIQSKADTQIEYIVWASQYGDETKTYKILEDVLQDMTPSPTQFSTSVHNAIAGLYSILCQDATPSTSLSATWSEALVEAYAYLKTQAINGKALVVYYDEPLPAVYTEYTAFQGFAMAALIELNEPNLMLKLDNISNVEHKFMDALNFHDFFKQTSADEMRVWSLC